MNFWKLIGIIAPLAYIASRKNQQQKQMDSNASEKEEPNPIVELEYSIADLPELEREYSRLKEQSDELDSQFRGDYKNPVYFVAARPIVNKMEKLDSTIIKLKQLKHPVYGPSWMIDEKGNRRYQKSFVKGGDKYSFADNPLTGIPSLGGGPEMLNRTDSISFGSHVVSPYQRFETLPTEQDGWKGDLFEKYERLLREEAVPAAFDLLFSEIEDG